VRFAGRMTLEEIGDALGLSRERVRQVEGAAIAAVSKSVQAVQERRRAMPAENDD
jgi:DNA-directed RNA polymerase sigma subunit (sigma70/sigma32)